MEIHLGLVPINVEVTYVGLGGMILWPIKFLKMGGRWGGPCVLPFLSMPL